MKSYIDKWVQLISNCKFNNTYKMAWAKAIIEYSLEFDGKCQEEDVIIKFQDLAPFILKYYWNQTIYFNLIQGANLEKEPEIKQYTECLIKNYFYKNGDKNPMRFEKVDFKKLGLETAYRSTINKIVKTLKQDVSYRFLNLSNKKIDIYKCLEKEEKILINKENLSTLKEYSDLFFQIINYRWTQILESFNLSPKVASKVRATHELDGTKRKSLKSFHSILEIENPEHICFFTGDKIPDNSLSVDHVIPWSFMFSDDPWNLVFCKKEVNSSKSNNIVDEDTIKKLESRNKELSKLAKEKGINNKKIHEIELSIEKDYLRKFWIALKG